MLLHRLRKLLRSMLLPNEPTVIVWQKDIKPCIFCQKPLATLDSFCRFCGIAQYIQQDPQTTGHHFNFNLLKRKPAVVSLDTSDLRAIYAGTDRPMHVYRGILKERHRET